jgi:uncharacterized membrane protein (DUF485 family)
MNVEDSNATAYEILAELKQDKCLHDKMRKRYKVLHTILYHIHFIANTAAIGFGSGVIGTLSSGVGVPLSVPFAVGNIALGSVGVVAGMLDKRMIKKIKKHSDVLSACRVTEREVNRCMISDVSMTDILDVVEKYYKQKEELESKALLNGNNLDKLRQEFRELHAVTRSHS